MFKTPRGEKSLHSLKTFGFTKEKKCVFVFIYPKPRLIMARRGDISGAGCGTQ